MTPRPEDAVTKLLLEEDDDLVAEDEEAAIGSFGGHGNSHPDQDPFKAIHLSIDESSSLLGNTHGKRSNLMCLGLGNAWQWYQERLDKKPILTKSITAAILTGAGDMAGQVIEQTTGTASASSAATIRLDVYRTICFALLGLLLQAPITHYYYVLLDAKLPPTQNPWTGTTLVKFLIDQFLWAPSFNLAVFVFLDTLEGHPQTMIQHIQQEYVQTMLANWKLWIPASIINMAFCPPQLRVLYCNVIFFVWSICLSLLLNDSSGTDDNNNNTAMTVTTMMEQQQQYILQSSPNSNNYP